MNTFKCEMCGSNDLVKQDGLFVCQSCGCKYSVEEAKKLMVSVDGPVQVADMAKFDNILKLAQSSYDSKNYKQAEEFCNQAIAIDSTNYAVWKLKGEAINYQINKNNPRIQEVYDCIITSYNILNDEEKESHRMEILKSLKTCLEGEVDYWLKTIAEDRPSDATIKRAENSYVDSWNKMKAAFELLGLEDSKKEYLDNLDNYFISRACVNGVNIWSNVVFYNYARGNMVGGEWKNDDYRPNDSIFSTFIKETDCLIDLYHFCEKQFNGTTPLTSKKAVYNNISVCYEDSVNAGSWKRMVRSTKVGYAGIGTTIRNEFWQASRNLTAEAKQIRRNEEAKYKAKVEEMKKLIAKEEADKKSEAEKAAAMAKSKKRDEYWAAHADEKSKLEEEKSSLNEEIKRIEEEISAIPELKEKAEKENKISQLNSEKSSLGVFKAKEKKAIQEEIDAVQVTLDSIVKVVTQKTESLQVKIKVAKNRISEIDNELTKDR